MKCHNFKIFYGLSQSIYKKNLYIYKNYYKVFHKVSKKMEYSYKIKTFMDTFNLYNTNRNKYNDKNTKSVELYIFHIEVREEMRRKGIISSFIKELYKLDSIRKLGLLSIGSTAMIKQWKN